MRPPVCADRGLPVVYRRCSAHLLDIQAEVCLMGTGKRASKTAPGGETAKEKQLLGTISGLQSALDKAQNDQQAGVSNAKYMQVSLDEQCRRCTRQAPW